MIAFLASRTKLAAWAIELILAGLIVLAFLLWNWHERHVGAQGCLKSDAAAVARDQSQAQKEYVLGQTTVFNEASDYDRTIHAPVEHPIHVSLCQSPRGGSPAQDPAPSAVDHANAPVSEPGAGSAVQRDIGPELLAIGRDADAQVSALEDYVLKVCRVR